MRRKSFAFFICLCLLFAVGVLPSFAEDGGDDLPKGEGEVCAGIVGG